MSTVKWKRPELVKIQPIYQMIEDCIDGELAVKNRGVEYLPMPSPDDLSVENRARYEAYKKRAVFYNVTERTLNGLVGEIFSREPIVESPDELSLVLNNMDGEGVNINQSSKRACEITLSNGRCGLFVDYPSIENPVSIRDMKEGRIRPTISIYNPSKIINWRTKQIGSENVLSLVVLEEIQEIYVDSFERKIETQYRVLRLGPGSENPKFDAETDSNVYTVEIYKNEAHKYAISESYQPTDFSGKTFSEIPFIFIGSENNDHGVDNPPMYSLASLNIHHYMNSADYEETGHVVGQATPWATGLTKDWINNVLGGKISFGSRGGIPLPPDATVGLLQAESNTINFEAMQHKERQMAALGARIVEQSIVQRTATEASLESNVENSILSTVAKNVSDAYTKALQIASLFVGKLSSKISFELNSDFNLANMTSEQRRQIISDWVAGAISNTEMRMNYRYSGLKLLDDSEAMKEIEESKEKEIERQSKSIKSNFDKKG